jgi:4'-phosphopantetheinyl transferase
MPLQHIIHTNSHTIIGVWHLKESETFFTPKLNEFVTETTKLNSISHSKRRTEWLAGRWLVRELAARINLPFTGVWTDDFNKPHLVSDNAYISISHASPYVVAILNTKAPCGIDVEKIRDKLLPLAPKFLNEGELALANDNLTTLAILWGAKEALYKLHGRKSLIFKENLAIENFNLSKDLGKFSGLLNINEEHEKYSMRAGKFDNFVLVYTE